MMGIFAVLNPGGRDDTRLFPSGAGSPGDPGHAPVNYHAYAACRRGGFFRRTRDLPEGTGAVLVLLRRNGLHQALGAVREMQTRGARVLISWKESGLAQVAETLADPRRYECFVQICAQADGFLSSTPDLVPLYQSAGAKTGDFVPTPYPLEEPAWDFFRPSEERKGIFIGTREFSVPSRNHLLALSAACRLGEPVTVINTDGRSGSRLLASLSPNLRIISGRLPYPEYLRLMAGHRLVFQLDGSTVPGQVAGDALLCRVPCVGGDGAIERLAFPDLCGAGRDVSALLDVARTLLGTDETTIRQQMIERLEKAAVLLGFQATADRLEQIFTRR